MKKNQSIRVKDTENNTIYKVVDFMTYRENLLPIIEAHYCYRAHINYWGQLFTANALRPELNLNYSEVLAQMCSLPEEKEKVSNILEANKPHSSDLKSSCQNALVEIHAYLLGVGYNGNIVITHEIIKNLLRPLCAVEIIQEKMTDRFFKDSIEHPFERNYEATSFFREPICNMIAEAFGWKEEWNYKSDQVHRCIMTAREIDPFTSKDTEKELDDYIFFSSQVDKNAHAIPTRAEGCVVNETHTKLFFNCKKYSNILIIKPKKHENSHSTYSK
jgi:hypothetical protein